MTGATPDLSRVLWIGGATDSGKTTIARRLGEAYGLSVYEYDRTDRAHHERLAAASPDYSSFLQASLDDRWVRTTPEALLERALKSFRDRFPLVLEDLAPLVADGPAFCEGFGLMPSIVAPLLASPAQAVWLVPSEAFKVESMRRRGKPSFSSQVSDPERARQNVLRRDMLLAARVRAEARSLGLTVLEVDGSRSLDEITAAVAAHFARFLAAARTGVASWRRPDSPYGGVEPLGD